MTSQKTKYVFVGQSSAAEGKDSEFNDWYVGKHMPEMMKLAGVVSVRRFRLAGAQLPRMPTPQQYLAIYEIETDAPETFVKDMIAKAMSGQLPASGPASAPGSTGVVWEELK
jgi:hypothetical protein